MKTTIQEMLQNAEKFYSALNAFVSMGENTLADLAYPEHDGNADGEVIADMMMLRERLNSIKNGCDIAINHINEVINL